MKLTKAIIGHGLNRKEGKGMVLYGNKSFNDNYAWFERWYPTEDAALRYANKKGWLVERAINQ